MNGNLLKVMEELLRPYMDSAERDRLAHLKEIRMVCIKGNVHKAVIVIGSFIFLAILEGFYTKFSNLNCIIFISTLIILYILLICQGWTDAKNLKIARNCYEAYLNKLFKKYQHLI